MRIGLDRPVEPIQPGASHLASLVITQIGFSKTDLEP